MSDIELVIKIPEETYEYWKEHKYEYVLSEAIANGVVLPKGHERLMDEKILLRKLRSRNFGFDVPTWVKVAIDNTPTIIEADKENKE